LDDWISLEAGSLRRPLLQESSIPRERSGFNFWPIWTQKPAFHRHSKLTYSRLLHIKLLSIHCVTFAYNFNFEAAIKYLILLKNIGSDWYVSVAIIVICRVLWETIKCYLLLLLVQERVLLFFMPVGARPVETPGYDLLPTESWAQPVISNQPLLRRHRL
jgi:hypothetical protein